MLAALAVAFMVLIGVLVMVLLAAIAIYNRLVRMRTTSKSAWADIDVHLRKRYDLVPNLVETVRGYANHESSVFERVTEARSAAMRAVAPADKAKAENVFSDALKSLFAVAEAYPVLQSSENFATLQSQLKEIEDSIESARRYYNAVVREYDIAIESFPSNIIASTFSFVQAEFFELNENAPEREPVKVSF